MADNLRNPLLLMTGLALLLQLPLGWSTNFRAPTFHLELGNSGGLGLGIADQNVTVTIASGTLNSSVTTLTNSYRDGYLAFNSSTLGTFDLDYSSGLRVIYDGSNTDTGDTLSFTAHTYHVLRWNGIVYDPYDHFTDLGIGLFGFLLLGIGCFYGATRLSSKDEMLEKLMGLALALFAVLAGSGLIIGWLW